MNSKEILDIDIGKSKAGLQPSDRSLSLVEKTEYTLLTNISAVKKNDDPIRFHCRAILLSRAVTLRPFENETIKILTEKGANNIFTGNILTMADGIAFSLYSEDYERPIDIYTQTGDILGIWNVFYENTAEYWNSPNMPRLTWVQAPNSYRKQRERERSTQ